MTQVLFKEGDQVVLEGVEFYGPDYQGTFTFVDWHTPDDGIPDAFVRNNETGKVIPITLSRVKFPPPKNEDR